MRVVRKREVLRVRGVFLGYRFLMTWPSVSSTPHSLCLSVSPSVSYSILVSVFWCSSPGDFNSLITVQYPCSCQCSQPRSSCSQDSLFLTFDFRCHVFVLYRFCGLSVSVYFATFVTSNSSFCFSRLGLLWSANRMHTNITLYLHHSECSWHSQFTCIQTEMSAIEILSRFNRTRYLPNSIPTSIYVYRDLSRTS